MTTILHPVPTDEVVAHRAGGRINARINGVRLGPEISED